MLHHLLLLGLGLLELLFQLANLLLKVFDLLLWRLLLASFENLLLQRLQITFDFLALQPERIFSRLERLGLDGGFHHHVLSEIDIQIV